MNENIVLVNQWLLTFKCNSYRELYQVLKNIARDKMEMDRLPFPLSALEYPEETINTDIQAFILDCFIKLGDNGDTQAKVIKLIEYLKKNPPKPSFKNPKLSGGKCTQDEFDLMNYVYIFGLELPGSKNNPFGHLQSFSSFFIDMFFGNYTEFKGYINGTSTSSSKDLHKVLEKREGYCQYSPLFAPILGLKMVNFKENVHFTSKERKEIKIMYNGNNEHKHLEILEELLELGADPNAHDIFGYTPLHFAIKHLNEGMVNALLSHGANPNSEARDGLRPLSGLALLTLGFPIIMRIIHSLIQHNSKLTNKEEINVLRTLVQTYGSKDLAVRVREAMPRDENECELCVQFSTKRCSGCALVFYCTAACQKLDWKFHKVTCNKNKRKK